MLRNAPFIPLQLTSNEIDGICGDDTLALVYPAKTPGIRRPIQKRDRSFGRGAPSLREQGVNDARHAHEGFRLSLLDPSGDMGEFLQISWARNSQARWGWG